MEGTILIEAAQDSLAGCRVLVLEDEFYIADDLARGLRERGAQTLGPASSVSQAERIVAAEEVDAAIVDLNVRGDIPAEFVKQLEAQQVACLIVSGYGGEAVPDVLRQLPRLEKPVAPSTVLNRLAEIVSAWERG